MNDTRDTSDGRGRLVGADRVLAVLTELAGYPEGVGLEQLATALRSPKPTVHRALASLRRAGLAVQDSRGHYVLGDEFVRLAFTFSQARPDHVRIAPVLRAMADRFGETAHYAVLGDREVVYRAKADPPSGAVRLTSTVGGRNPAHATAVGKLLLSARLATLDDVRAWIGDRPLPTLTPRTLTSPGALHEELVLVRRQGYAVDDQENEAGVTCLALPVFLGPRATPSGAVSVSALAYRTPLPALVAALPLLRDLLAPLGPPGPASVGPASPSPASPSPASSGTTSPTPGEPSCI